MGNKCQSSLTLFVIKNHCQLIEILDFPVFLLIPVEPPQFVSAELVTKTQGALDFSSKPALSSLSMRTNLLCQEVHDPIHATGKLAEQTFFPSHLCFQQDKAEEKNGTNLLTLARYFLKVGEVNGALCNMAFRICAIFV